MKYLPTFFVRIIIYPLFYFHICIIVNRITHLIEQKMLLYQ